jgi:FlaG/FlaF family flagellin (archaellin)
MRRVVLALSIVVAAVTLRSAPAVAGSTTDSAAAPTATIQILSTTLVAKGAAIDIAYAVDCPAGYSGSTALDVAQPTAHGTAVDELTCSGTGLLYLQRVTADVTGTPFARGKATLTMQAAACNGAVCFATPFQATVKIVR